MQPSGDVDAKPRPNYYRAHYHVRFFDCKTRLNDSSIESYAFNASDDETAFDKAKAYMGGVLKRLHDPADLFHGVRVWDVKLTGLEKITYVPKQIEVEETTEIPITPIILQ